MINVKNDCSSGAPRSYVIKSDEYGKSNQVIDFLKDVVVDGNMITALIIDSGAEFKSTDTQTYLRKNNIEHIYILM